MARGDDTTVSNILEVFADLAAVSYDYLSTLDTTTYQTLDKRQRCRKRVVYSIKSVVDCDRQHSMLYAAHF